MKIRGRLARNAVAAVAVAGVAAIALAGCTTTGGGTESTSKNITIAQVNEVTSFNSNTPQGNLDTNGEVAYLTQPQFYTLNQKFDVLPNTDLGTYKKLSDDPLKVKYTLNKDAKWSDGKPMTADDLLLG